MLAFCPDCSQNCTDSCITASDSESERKREAADLQDLETAAEEAAQARMVASPPRVADVDGLV
jgi:hypothetical protein